MKVMLSKARDKRFTGFPSFVWLIAKIKDS